MNNLWKEWCHILYQLLESELPRDVCYTKTNPKYLQIGHAGVSDGLFSQW